MQWGGTQNATNGIPVLSVSIACNYNLAFVKLLVSVINVPEGFILAVLGAFIQFVGHYLALRGNISFGIVAIWEGKCLEYRVPQSILTPVDHNALFFR